jgi:hypothetical protein
VLLDQSGKTWSQRGGQQDPLLLRTLGEQAQLPSAADDDRGAGDGLGIGELTLRVETHHDDHAPGRYRVAQARGAPTAQPSETVRTAEGENLGSR